MNHYFYALLCYCMAIFLIVIYGLHKQQFTPVYKLHSVQKTDKLNGTSDPPITDGACISWSNDSVEYRIQAIGYDNIETFDEDGIKVLFMIGDLVKIMVLETGNVWLCQFSTARWARQFNSENGPGESTDDLPYFKIDVLNEEAPFSGRETFHDVALYIKTYGLPQSDRKMFILKPSPRANLPVRQILMIFLSGRFSIEKTGDLLRFTFEDAKDRSCTMRIFKNGDNNVEKVFNAISPYARRTNTDQSGWVSNSRYDKLGSFSLS